jgi:plastocyanin
MRFLVVLVICTVGCLPQVGPLLETDSGAGGGAGGGAGATCTNGQTDGDESDLDCGGSCPGCALNATCHSAADCSSGVCVSGHCSTAANPCRANFAGCTTFLDLADAGATIRFPAGGQRYSPNCLRLHLGQSVTFVGDFGPHPLSQACGPVNGLFSAGLGNSFTTTFTAGLGVYGYFCSEHGSSNGSGMAGAIEVVR